MRNASRLWSLILLAPWVLPAQTASERAAAAGAAMQRGDYRVAESHYVALTEERPDVAELHSNLGLARMSLGDSQGAETAFRRALELDPNTLAPQFLLGTLLLEAGRHAEAVPLLQSASRARPSDPSIRRSLAAALAGLGRPREAAAEYKALLGVAPSDPGLLYEIGKLYLQQGQLAFDRLASHPGSAFFLLVNAEFQSRRPRFQAVASDFFRKAIEAGPGHAALRTALGMFLLRQRDWQGAREAFDGAVERDAAACDAFFGRAFAKLADGEWDAAAADIEEAARLRPGFFRPLPPPPVDELSIAVPDRQLAVAGFGTAYLRWVFAGEPASPPTGTAPLASGGLQRMRDLVRARRYEEAINARVAGELESDYLEGVAYRELGRNALARVVEADPESALALQLSADSLYAENRFEAAAAKYEAALEKRPGDADLLVSLGNARLRQPDFPRATAAYRQALAVQPGRSEASYNFGLALAAQNLHAEALEPLRNALESDPGLLSAHAALGRSLAALGETAAAVRHLEAAASADEDGTLHYRLFQLYRQLGRDEDAEAARRRSTELRP